MAETKEIFASALVYGSTYSRDYDPNFLLKPRDFNTEDIIWARNFVLESVSYCDELEGIRRVIFGNEKYLVFGISGILTNLLERSLSDEESRQYQEYAFDRNKRNIKCFLGLVCHIEEKSEGEFFQLAEKEFLVPYLKEVARKEIWYSGEKKDQRSEYEYSLMPVRWQGENNLKDCIFVSTEKQDEELFYRVLSMNAYGRKSVSLCTNQYNLRMVERKLFTYVTAGANTVRQYQKRLDQSTSDNRIGTKEHENRIQENDKKNRNIIVASLGIGVITAVIIILLLVTLGQKKRETQRSMNVFDEFYKGEELESNNYTLNELFESQKKYASLVREYKPEIEYVQNCLKDLREEEKLFYEKELPEILNILKDADVNEESRKEWLAKLRDSMAKSFNMSKSLLDDLVIKQMDEFKRAAEEILRGGTLV